MTTKLSFIIPFIKVDPSQNPNMRTGGVDASLSYFRAMAVTFASIKRVHPAAGLKLITNCVPQEEVVKVLSDLGVAIATSPFNHQPPKGFSRTFEGSLFLLDTLEYLNSETTVLVDPDVLFIRPMNTMLQDLKGRAGAVRIDYSDRQNINGLSRSDAMILHNLLGSNLESPYKHLGGEFYVIPRDFIQPLRKRAAEAWELSLARFASNETRFTTEEHILTYALSTIPQKDINDYVRRIWTAHSFRNVKRSDFELTAWHLPAEKTRGFAALYPLVLDPNSWFWNSSELDFVKSCSKLMGMRSRGLQRLIIDTAGRGTRRIREIRVPVSDRRAG